MIERFILLFQIPLINSTHTNDLKEGNLVRFCGMIQDMYDPVYYLASYEVHDTITNKNVMRSGKFKDSLQCAVSFTNNIYKLTFIYILYTVKIQAKLDFSSSQMVYCKPNCTFNHSNNT